MLRRLFTQLNGQAKTITSAAVIIGAASLASKLLGVFRDRVLAGLFGAERTLDIYYTSFRIPDLVFNLLVLGTLSAGFIPIFTEYIKKDSKEAWKIVNNLLTLMLFGLIAVCGILIFFTPFIVKFLAPGFSQQELETTSNLARIMFLSPILLGIAGIFGSMLQSFRQFLVFSLAPIMYNIGIIIGAIFFTPSMGIYGLGWGVVLGAFFHMLVQIPSVLWLGYRPRIDFTFIREGVRKILIMMVPRTLSLIINQINLVVVTIIGSTLQEGSITIFNFANNIQSVPLVIFGVSYAIAVFPTLSEYSNHKEKFIENFSLTLRQILFFVIPASALLIILRAQIVRALLGSGRFDWNDTVLTMNTLAIFSTSLFAQCLIHLFSRAFFAKKDSMTPFIVGVISSALNIILSILFIKIFFKSQVEGLALAFSISSIINLLLLWIVLKIRIGDIDEARIFASTVKIAIASFCMALSVQGVKYAIEPFFGTQTFVGIAIQGGVASITGVLIYFIVCFALQSAEAILFVSSLQKKFLSRFTPTESVE